MKSMGLKHRNRCVRLQRERGASLLEGIAYLGIAAIVILGAVSLLTGAFSSAQANRLAEEVISIRTGVKKLYMSQSTGYGTDKADLTANLILAKVFPSTIAQVTSVTGTNSVTKPTNAWGGEVKVQSAGSTFTITYDAVPQDVCISTLTGASGWNSITVGDKVAGTPPITPADAANTLCVNAANTIIWAAS